MNKIDKEELYDNLKHFLKSKGIELQEGSYTQRIHRTCGILSDSVNLSQQALERAKTAMDKGLDQLRQAIHEKTAARPAATGAKPETADRQSRCQCGAGARPKAATRKPKTAKRRTRKA